jgi:hypothetical protein
MKTEIAKMWAEALRSGNYKQGKNCLRRYKLGVVEYCCLGVLCEIYARTQEGQQSDLITTAQFSQMLPDSIMGQECEAPYAGASEYLPDVVVNWAGMGSCNPIIPLNEPQTPQTLSDINDSLRASFNEIADIIESHVEIL